MKLLALSCLFFFSSCGLLVKALKSSEKSWTIKDTSGELFCERTLPIELIGGTKEMQNAFLNLIRQQSKKGQIFYFGDLVILWSFAQMNQAPIQSSPSARLMATALFDGKEVAIDSRAEKKAKKSNPVYLTYIHGLFKLHDRLPTNYSMSQLAFIFDRLFHYEYKVSEELANQLDAISFETPNKKNPYVRGDEILQVGEGLERNKITPQIRNYQNDRSRYQTVSSEMRLYAHKLTETSKQNSDIQYRCNTNLNLYEDSLFLVHEKAIETNLFGLHSGDSLFVASSTMRTGPKAKFLPKSYFIEGRSDTRTAAFCQRKAQTGPLLWLFADRSRDPGQHLYHLTKYQLDQVTTPEQLAELIKFSRHVFLTDPLRLLFEATRASDEQIQNLLQLNFPLYQADQLGRIWGFYRFQSQQSFIVDDRHERPLNCLE